MSAPSEPANGLFGPGIFATGIDLSALDVETAFRLGTWIGEQIRQAEERGYTRGCAVAIKVAAAVMDEDDEVDR